MANTQPNSPPTIASLVYHVPLRVAMDPVWDSAFPSFPQLQGRHGFPATDLYQTDSDIVIRMALPGAEPDDIQISAAGKGVSISGQLRQAPANGQRLSHVEEIPHGTFQRSITLPVEVDPEKAVATYQNGILTLTLPTSRAAQVRRVPVQQTQPGDGKTEASAPIP